MARISRFMSVYALFFCSLALTCTVSEAAPKEKKVKAVMEKTTEYMMNKVSCRGGFVWKYTADLSKQWGEVPARKTQIWVQGATNGVGEMLLDAYEVTGEKYYLEYAKKVASAIIWGQHPAGGWHYFIDFDMTGIQKWYDDVASKCWGWEEYYHYYGNCTYDDNSTTSSIRFLMRLYMLTLDPAYKVPLIKAFDFILESQFENGAWPQRYPLKYDYVKNGKPDYTSFYTFNDGVMWNNIMVLFSAYEMLGNEEYYKAARRGMDFYIISQYGKPQAGWSAQHSHDMKPTYARSYEPEGVWTASTLNNISNLYDFYRITGDRKYLDPIPAAVEWLENSYLDTDITKKYTHARVYELGTNRPIYTHREGTSIENGRYYQDYEFGNFICHYGQVTNIDVPAVRKEFERVSSLSPEQAIEEYERKRNAKIPPVLPKADTGKVESILESLNGSSAWITDIRIPNYNNPCAEGRGTTIRGISTGIYINNMKMLIAYLSEKKREKAK